MGKLNPSATAFDVDPKSVKKWHIQFLTRGGDTRRPRTNSQVFVHCTGYGKNGNLAKQFWSTRKEDGGDGKLFSFHLGMGEVIPAWDVGVAQMAVGDRARVIASPKYGYGPDISRLGHSPKFDPGFRYIAHSLHMKSRIGSSTKSQRPSAL